MYFYEIEVYYPFCENDKIVMGHDECFDNHQLNIIVQEAFDECIEKYIDKPVLDKGEEACRIEVGTIFEKHLPSQLKNHGFKSIKIAETCSIMGGVLFCDNGVNNPVLKDRYKDEVLPPCGKCMRETSIGSDGKCVVPNTRKDTRLPTTRVVKTIPINLNEEKTEKNNEDSFYIDIIKFYFNNSRKILQDKRIAAEATIAILENNNLEDFWTEYGIPEDGVHKDDISCGFDMEFDEKKAKDLLINYGFILQKSEDGFWITGVKE